MQELLRRIYFSFFGTYEKQWNFWARDLIKAQHAVIPGFGNQEAFNTSGQNSASKLLSYVSPANTVLEIGCGTGRILKHIAPHCKEIHGLDVSKKMLTFASQYLNEFSNVHLHCTKGYDLKLFPNNSFDVVFAFYVLQHIVREHAVYYLTEMARVVKPGGILAFEMPNLLFPRNLALYLKTCQRSRHFSIARTRFYTEQEARAIAQALGLEVLDCTVGSEILLIARRAPIPTTQTSQHSQIQQTVPLHPS